MPKLKPHVDSAIKIQNITLELPRPELQWILFLKCTKKFFVLEEPTLHEDTGFYSRSFAC
jgi:hypothetical protein